MSNPKAAALVEFLVKGNLTFGERLSALSAIGLIDEAYEIPEVISAVHKLRLVESTNDFAKMAMAALEEAYGEALPLAEECNFGMKKVVHPAIVKAISEESEAKDEKKDDKKSKGNFDPEAKKFEKKGESKPLAKALRSKGLDQNDLADRLGVNKSTVSRIKNGRRRPSFETMKKLTKSLGSGITTLFPELR